VRNDGAHEHAGGASAYGGFVRSSGRDSNQNCRQIGDDIGREASRPPDGGAAVSVEVGVADGVAEVVIDFPPVNALPVKGWYDLAAALTETGADPATRAVVLAAGGRGFCAGVDIKEMQRTSGHDALLGANSGCAAAFAAVYDCPVPVIAAVHGFCLGGGVGLAGSADIVMASQDATFGLPEVDRGALGAATHLARLVPQPLMRAMVYTCRTVSAAELKAFGTVLEVVPREELRDRARALAEEIAAKDPQVIRLAKQSLNGIDPVDVKRSYRYEQGFTFELTLGGAGDKARQAFVDGRPQ
jgi:enoyl-CoA hydratase/carnithine racemase